MGSSASAQGQGDAQGRTSEPCKGPAFRYTVQRGHAGPLELTSCCSADRVRLEVSQKPWKDFDTRTFLHKWRLLGTAGKPPSLAKEKTLQHLLDLQSWPCSEPRAGPETSRGLPTHLLLQPPVTRPGLPVPTCRYCRYPCTLPDSCWDVSQHTRESSTNKKIAGWCQDFHVSLSQCQKRDSARHRQFVEEPALWGHIQDMPPSLLRAEWETLNHPQDNNSCPPVGSYTMPPALEACKGNPHSLPKGSVPAEEGQNPKRAVQGTVDTLSMVLPPTARSMKKVRDPYVGSCAGAAAPEGSADTGLGAAAPWAAADSCVPAAPPASGAGMCSVVSTSIS